MSEGEVQGLEYNELTEQQNRLKDLIFQSFRFSQGSPNTQSAMLRWLGAEGYLATIDVPEEIPVYIQELATPKKHKSIPDANRLKEFGLLWRRVRSAKAQSLQLSAEEQLRPILLGMINKDIMYQGVGRPNRQPAQEITPDSSNDPHASFVRKYIINSQSSGNDVFNELFRALGPKVIRYQTANPRYEDRSHAETRIVWICVICINMKVSHRFNQRNDGNPQ